MWGSTGKFYCWWKYFDCIGCYISVCCAVLSRSVVSNSLWPHGLAAHQVPLSMGIRHTRIQEWISTPSSDLPNPGIKLRSPTWLVDSLSSEPPENLGKNSRGRVKDKIFVLKYSLWSWKEANQWQQQQQNKVLTIENQNTTHWSQYEQSWISHIKHFMSYKKAINPVNKECVSYKIIQCKIISSIIVM